MFSQILLIIIFKILTLCLIIFKAERKEYEANSSKKTKQKPKEHRYLEEQHEGLN